MEANKKLTSPNTGTATGNPNPDGETQETAAGLSPQEPDAGKLANRTDPATWIAIFTMFLNVLALVLTANHNRSSLEAVRRQIELHQKEAEQSRPVDFRVETSVDARRLQLTISNWGSAAIDNLRARLAFYFLLPNREIVSAPGVSKQLEESEDLLERFRRANVLTDPGDVRPLLGASRDFFVKGLGGRPDNSDAPVFRPELSQGAILNAIRIASFLDARVILRWRFSYQHRSSRKGYSSSIYLLLETEPTSSSILNLRPQQVTPLSEVIGGTSVVESIQEHEAESLEVIFPNR